jgi:hypothetical protein
MTAASSGVRQTVKSLMKSIEYEGGHILSARFGAETGVHPAVHGQIVINLRSAGNEQEAVSYVSFHGDIADSPHVDLMNSPVGDDQTGKNGARAVSDRSIDQRLR